MMKKITISIITMVFLLFSCKNVINSEKTGAQTNVQEIQSLENLQEQNGSCTSETYDISGLVTGSIKGKITLDSSQNNNEGFVVFASATSFMAVTGKDGNFIISDVPADTVYDIIIMKGNYTYLWKTNIKVNPFEEINIGEHNVLSSELNSSTADISDVKYLIYYELDNGTLPYDAPLVHAYGATTTLVNPVREGYAFAGYFLTEDYTGNPVTTLGRDYLYGQKIYAKWIMESMYDLFCIEESTTIELNGIISEEYIDDLCFILQQIFERDPSIEIKLDFSNATEIRNRYINRYDHIDIQNFDDCNNIVEITASDVLLKNDKYSRLFSGCKSIKKVIVTEGSLSIPDNAFKSCKWLTDIEIPASVTSIGDSAFSGCSSLPAFVLSDNVTSLGGYVFSGCTGLTTISIPDSISSIGEHAFSGCISLTTISIPDSISSIEKNTFSGCTSLTTVSIPNTITKIGDSAFSGCTSLDDIVIPANVTNLGPSVFYNCSSLTNITIPDTITTIPSDMLSGCTSLQNFVIPDTVTVIWQRAFAGCTALTSINIPYGVSTIYQGTFMRCSSLASITIPDTVITIEEYAFYLCSSLTSIIMPDTDCLNFIGEYAFSGCSGLTELSFPNREHIWFHIERYAFSDCTGLTSVSLPECIGYIGEYAFSGCTGITSVEITRNWFFFPVWSNDCIDCIYLANYNPAEIADKLTNTYTECIWYSDPKLLY